MLKILASLAVITMISSTAVAEQVYKAVPGEFLVKLKDTSQLSSGTKALSGLAMKMGSQFKKVVSLKGNTILVKRPVVERMDFALSSLKTNSMVEVVSPNYYHYLQETTPIDEFYDQLWGLKNPVNPGIDINAERAWDVTRGDRRVVVAVIDTGIDYDHPDLAANIWMNEREIYGTKGVDDDGNGYIDDKLGWDFANGDNDPMDNWGHGTHCAGTIGAVGNNGYGVVGVNWEVSLMAVQIFSVSKGAATEADIIAAIDYATDNGAHVMSNSWGGGPPSVLMEESIARAMAADILFIAAAGNNGSDNDKHAHFPSNYELDNVISVAAIGPDGSLARFSNYGVNTVDVAAPGVDILSTIPGEAFGAKSGTSMATPHVSGIAALMIAADPSIPSAEIKRRILKSSVPINTMRGRTLTGGLVNAKRAVMNMTW